jgi:pilus assembly protein CpaE
MHLFKVGLAIANENLRDCVRGYLHTAGVRVVLDQEPPIETGQLKRFGLDLVLVDVNPEGGTVEETIRRIKTVSPGTMVAIVHESPDPEVILGAMRAGADEFVLPPFEEKLALALQRIAGQLSKREAANRPSGKVIGIVSAKGGCGASTVACHMAAELQRATRHDVLLADLDLESGLIGFLMKTANQYSILDAVKNIQRLDYSFWKGLVSNARPRLDVMPAPDGLVLSDTWNPTHFKDVFRLIRSMYGWVIADLGRTLNPIALTVLDDLDEVFLVATPSVAALYQAKLFINRITGIGFPLHQLRLVLNRVPKRCELTPDDLRRALGLSVYAELPERPELDAAYAEGKLLGATSDLGKALAGVAWKMAGIREEKTRSWSFFSTKKEPGFLEA